YAGFIEILTQCSSENSCTVTPADLNHARRGKMPYDAISDFRIYCFKKPVVVVVNQAIHRVVGERPLARIFCGESFHQANLLGHSQIHPSWHLFLRPLALFEVSNIRNRPIKMIRRYADPDFLHGLKCRNKQWEERCTIVYTLGNA